jgi:anti-anti-sigma regulatory factor
MKNSSVLSRKIMDRITNVEIIKTIFDSNPEIKKHFILNILELKKGRFFYMGLREDSTGKNLESIIPVIDDIFTQIDKYQFKNVAFSFKEVTYFGDIGMATIFGMHGWITKNGGKFIFLEPNPKIENIFKVIGVYELESVYKSEAEFIKAMNN